MSEFRWGSEQHKTLFCRTLLDTFNPYKPAVIDWPELDPPALATRLPATKRKHAGDRINLFRTTAANDSQTPTEQGQCTDGAGRVDLGCCDAVMLLVIAVAVRIIVGVSDANTSHCKYGAGRES